jgi:putative ABC transport system ATP-binding protein
MGGEVKRYPGIIPPATGPDRDPADLGLLGASANLHLNLQLMGQGPSDAAASSLTNLLPALEVRGVSRSLPLGRERIEILRDVSFRIARGEFVAIVGPSGSGKSTLLGVIAGLDNPSSGQVWIDGVEITHMSERSLAAIRNQKVGMVFQAFNLIPTLTALENVEVPLFVGEHSGSPTARATAMLDLVGLSHRLNHKPAELSGGEQQRVAIARALAADPAMVIMDEPTGNLDAANSRLVLDLIGELRGRTHTTFIIATHDSSIAEAAERVLELLDGRVISDSRSSRQPDSQRG